VKIILEPRDYNQDSSMKHYAQEAVMMASMVCIPISGGPFVQITKNRYGPLPETPLHFQHCGLLDDNK
jgi:hypothetical protein